MALLCVFLGVICVFDYIKGKIPNMLVIMIMLAGSGRGFYQAGLWGLGTYLSRLAGVILVLYPIFRIGGLGAGDVKLLGVCAGYFSLREIWYFLFFSMLVSAVFSIIKLFREHSGRDRLGYLAEYCRDVARSGRWRLYLPRRGGKRLSGVCMSGPILCSILLGLGGVY